MDTFILPSLSVLIGSLIHLTLRGVVVPIVKGHKSVVNESIAREESDLDSEKNVNGYGRSPRIFIPDVLARWPWPRRIHPHYAEIEKEFAAWTAKFQFKAFSPKVQDEFDRAEFALLSCLAHPTTSKEHARASAYFMGLGFVIDEYSERFAPSEVQKQKDLVLDVLHNPYTPRPNGEWIVGETVRQFWEINMQNATEVSQNRFIQVMDECLEGLVQQSIDRQHGHVHDIRSYMQQRRRTVGAKPAFYFIELGLDIPDEVMSHHAIQEMILAAVDMVALGNDMLSYNVEQMRGDSHQNIVTCVMNEHHTDVNGAILWIQDQLFELGDKFLAAMGSLPQWEEPLNSQVKEYCDGLGNWVRANWDWTFESERYFGNKGLEIKKNKWMPLLPKKGRKEVGPVHVDGSLL